LAAIPILNTLVNALSQNKLFRMGLESAFGVHRKALLPRYHRGTLRSRVSSMTDDITPKAVGSTTGKVALYGTCYGNHNSPQIGEDLFRVFQHNGIHIELLHKEQCCGMPKLELGDLDSVAKAKTINIPILARLVDQGFDLTAPIPSCVLMYKQELPLLFPDDPEVKKVQRAFYDPFEYLHLRHKEGELKTDFRQALGDISYQVACHLRVQNIGLKTRDILSLVPGTTVHTLERCSGHDGTYAVRAETHQNSVKIAQPVVRKVDEKNPQHFSSDCPMAGNHIAFLSKSMAKSTHPMTLLRQAYDI
jgi:glycerol-3-phosphate dehydrogenase subunit C